MTTTTSPFHPSDSATTGQSPLLRFEQLAKVYATSRGPYAVLENINLEVAKGEFVCVIGHSGCGKSTLLNMVSGFATPSSGQVLLEGKPITKPGPDRMVVFQGYALLPWMTAYENVHLAIDSVHPSLPESQKREIALGTSPLRFEPVAFCPDQHGEASTALQPGIQIIRGD